MHLVETQCNDASVITVRRLPFELELVERGGRVVGPASARSSVGRRARSRLEMAAGTERDRLNPRQLPYLRRQRAWVLPASHEAAGGAQIRSVVNPVWAQPDRSVRGYAEERAAPVLEESVRVGLRRDRPTVDDRSDGNTHQQLRRRGALVEELREPRARPASLVHARCDGSREWGVNRVIIPALSNS